jgi:hypothetical protein
MDNMIGRKILNSAEEFAVNSIKNTRENSILFSHEEMAVQAYPELFKHINRSRSNTKHVEDALTVLNDLTFLFAHLPESYKVRIVASREFEELVRRSFSTAKLVDAKNKKRRYLKRRSTEEFEKHSPQYYLKISSHMFTLALGTFIESAPPEFQELLKKNVQPFLELTKAISGFSESHKLTVELPKINTGFDKYLKTA